MNKTPEYRVGIGASSILMIFIVLSLTTLGVLSFASARANLALTTRRTAQVEAYYEAAAQAQTILSEVDAALLTAQADPETYDLQVRALRESDSRLSVDAKGVISFALPVGDTQELRVQVQANGAEAFPRYTLLSHYLMSTVDWEPDNSLTLLDGNTQHIH